MEAVARAHALRRVLMSTFFIGLSGMVALQTMAEPPPESEELSQEFKEQGENATVPLPQEANPWQRVFDDSLNFSPRSDHPSLPSDQSVEGSFDHLLDIPFSGKDHAVFFQSESFSHGALLGFGFYNVEDLVRRLLGLGTRGLFDRIAQTWRAHPELQVNMLRVEQEEHVAATHTASTNASSQNAPRSRTEVSCIPVRGAVSGDEEEVGSLPVEAGGETRATQSVLCEEGGNRSFPGIQGSQAEAFTESACNFAREGAHNHAALAHQQAGEIYAQAEEVERAVDAFRAAAEAHGAAALSEHRVGKLTLTVRYLCKAYAFFKKIRDEQKASEAIFQASAVAEESASQGNPIEKTQLLLWMANALSEARVHQVAAETHQERGVILEARGELSYAAHAFLESAKAYSKAGIHAAELRTQARGYLLSALDHAKAEEFEDAADFYNGAAEVYEALEEWKAAQQAYQNAASMYAHLAEQKAISCHAQEVEEACAAQKAAIAKALALDVRARMSSVAQGGMPSVNVSVIGASVLPQRAQQGDVAPFDENQSTTVVPSP